MPSRTCRPTALALLLASGCATGATHAPSDVERRMVDIGNTFRVQHGLAPVRPDPALSRAAQDFANFMARTDRYGHDADGRQPVQRAQAAGYAHCMVAENIAWQFRSRGFEGAALARALVQGWIDSPPHRRNLLDPEATDVAVAVARSSSTGRWYGVQMLARPAALRTRIEVGNRSGRNVQYRLDGSAFSLPPRARRWHDQCGPARLEVKRPGEARPMVFSAERSARFEIDGSGRAVRLR